MGVERLHRLVRGARGAEVRDRGAGLDRVRCVHLHVAVRVGAGQKDGAVRHDGRAHPMQVVRVLRRGRALRVGHRGPQHAGAVVLEVQHVGVVMRIETRPGRRVDEGLEAEAVPELVQHDRHEIEAAHGPVSVEAVVPGPRERAGRADRAVEGRGDVVRGRLVRTRELVGERLRVPGAGHERAREVPVDRGRARLPERRARRVAGERIHLRADADRHGARELRAPDVGGILEGRQPLRTEGRGAVAALRRDRRRVVEALVGSVQVHDRHDRGLDPTRARQGGEKREHKDTTTRHLSSVTAAHSSAWRTRSVPSGPIVTTRGL